MNEKAMQNALRKCVDFFGESILVERTRLRSALKDMLPGFDLQKERNLLLISLEYFSLGEKLLKAPPVQEVRERFCQSLLKEIIENGLGCESAVAVLQSFIMALDWKVKITAGNTGPNIRPALSCPHAHIDFPAFRCCDCGQTLYGIYKNNKYTPYEAICKQETNGVLRSLDESCSGIFVVPEHITALDDDCLSMQANLQDVILPASLRSIGRFAFENCSSLKKLKIPESVTDIGMEAFKGLRRVYYDGQATGSPWGAKEHIASQKSPPPKVQSESALQFPKQPQPSDLPTSKPDPLAVLHASYADKKVGERFEFGRYPQGVNGEEKPITWRVLRRDSDSLLIISDMALETKSYHKELISITWSECSLRRWLNSDFLQEAFTAQEQSLIKTSRLANNAGPETEDRVFLLSIDEAKSLFANDDDRMAKPTLYTIKNGAYTYNGNAWWWLRSRGGDSDIAAYIYAVGGIGRYFYYVDDASGAVRPALRAAL